MLKVESIVFIHNLCKSSIRNELNQACFNLCSFMLFLTQILIDRGHHG
jgi:hypothetical protein